MKRIKIRKFINAIYLGNSPAAQSQETLQKSLILFKFN